LFVELEEVEVAVSDLAEEGEHESTLTFSRGQVLGHGSFRGAARLAPDVEFPRERALDSTRSSGCAIGEIERRARGVRALREATAVASPREERRLGDSHVLACLFDVSHHGLEAVVIVVGIREESAEVRVLEDLPPREVSQRLI
jgi:hypothetical protein